MVRKNKNDGIKNGEITRKMKKKIQSKKNVKKKQILKIT